jgi:hypothetical protein
MGGGGRKFGSLATAPFLRWPMALVAGQTAPEHSRAGHQGGWAASDCGAASGRGWPRCIEIINVKPKILFGQMLCKPVSTVGGPESAREGPEQASCRCLPGGFPGRIPEGGHIILSGGSRSSIAPPPRVEGRRLEPPAGCDIRPPRAPMRMKASERSRPSRPLPHEIVISPSSVPPYSPEFFALSERAL